MQFSEILKLLMEEKDVTAYKMSKETGIPQPVIGRWKNGEQQPSSDSLRKIANYFCVSTDFLLSRQAANVYETNEAYNQERIVVINKDGKTLKKRVSEEEWEKYNKILKAEMPELFVD